MLSNKPNVYYTWFHHTFSLMLSLNKKHEHANLSRAHCWSYLPVVAVLCLNKEAVHEFSAQSKPQPECRAVPGTTCWEVGGWLQYSHPSQDLQFYIFRGHLSWRDQYCSCHPIPVLMVWRDGSLVIDTIKVVLSIQTEPISACTETPNKCLLFTFHQWLLCLRFFMSDILCCMTYFKNVELFLI